MEVALLKRIKSKTLEGYAARSDLYAREIDGEIVFLHSSNTNTQKEVQNL